MFDRTKAHDLRAELFGGTGNVRVWNLLGGGARGPFQAVLACELAAGGEVGKHVQQAFSEIVVVTEGQGRATLGNTTHDLFPGQVVFLPLGETLALHNTSLEFPLRYLIIKAGAQAHPG